MLFEYLIYHLFAFRNKYVFITNDAAYYYDTMIHVCMDGMVRIYAWSERFYHAF